MSFKTNVLEYYVGRSVRLKKQALDVLPRRRGQERGEFENYFLVAAISQEMKKLICYGANMRIAVGAADVVLI